jgi:hypothetical protein
MTTKNSYWPDGYFPTNYWHPDYWAGETTGGGPGGGMRLHWGRLDVHRPARQPDEVSSDYTLAPAKKRKSTRKKR